MDADLFGTMKSTSSVKETLKKPIQTTEKKPPIKEKGDLVAKTSVCFFLSNSLLYF